MNVDAKVIFSLCAVIVLAWVIYCLWCEHKHDAKHRQLDSEIIELVSEVPEETDED